MHHSIPPRMDTRKPYKWGKCSVDAPYFTSITGLFLYFHIELDETALDPCFPHFPPSIIAISSEIYGVT